MNNNVRPIVKPRYGTRSRFASRHIFLSLIFIQAFWISLIIAPFHVNGDQVHYTKAYDAMFGLELFEALHVYRSFVFSFEPVHFLVSWIFANLGIEKVVAMATLNGLLAALFGRFLLDRTKNYTAVIILVFVNPYLYAMFFTLEKLKVAMIFLLLFLNYKFKPFGLFAAIAHLQAGLLLMVVFASRYLSTLNFAIFYKLLHPRYILRVVIWASIAFVCMSALYDYGLIKVLFYYNRSSGSSSIELVPAFIFWICTIIFSNQNRSEITCYFIILALVIFFIGSERLNMFLYFGFLYYISYHPRKPINYVFFMGGMMISSLYLCYKSYDYLTMVVKSGG